MVRVTIDVTLDHPLDNLRDMPDYFGIWPCNDRGRQGPPLVTMQVGSGMHEIVRVDCPGCTGIRIEREP